MENSPSDIFKARTVVFLTQVLPIIFTIFGACLAFKFGIGVMEVVIFSVMYVINCIGMELGLHRFFTHKSFKAKEPLSVFLAITGSATAIGNVYFWTIVHRRHHAHSDSNEDLHSPNKGLFHAHMGWTYSKEAIGIALDSEKSYQTMFEICKFTGSSKVVKACDSYHEWVFLGIIIPAIAGGLWMGSWFGFLQGMLWGGFMRIFAGQHLIWGVNSLCHTVGNKMFKSNDKSLNGLHFLIGTSVFFSSLVYLCSPNNINVILTSVFAFVFLFCSWSGIWHNNHHAFPNSAYQQFYWWQLDPIGWVLLLLEKVGLAYDVNYPNKEQIRRGLSHED